MAYEYALTKGTILRHSSMLGEESVYTIEKVLGQGGFGITYLASMTIKIGHTPHKILFAIKEFFVKGQCWRESSNPQMKYSPAAKTEIDECKKDFVDEANRLNKICSENINIVNVNEVFEANDTAYYVMEYLSGDSLRDKILKNKGPFSETDALSMIIPIAESVEYLHDQYKLLHCDISPDNIMLRDNGDGYLTPVLIDFGESLHFNSKGELTTTHNAIGAKEGYAPQEQYRGVTSFDPQIDVYALAATLFYLLTGHRPISSFDITKDYIEREFPSALSSDVRRAILHGMEKEKANRTASVTDFINELGGASQEPPAITDELPIGFRLHNEGKVYQIVSVVAKGSYYIRYKATRENEGASPGQTRRAQVDIYEFFADGIHHRSEDFTVFADGNLSKGQQLFLRLCDEKTTHAVSRQLKPASGLGWMTFEANNTYYLVWSKVRKPLPWKRMLTYSAAVAGALLLGYGVVSIVRLMGEAKERERLDMSQRLTHGIETSNADSLRIFAVDYDSTRAYLPYAQVSLENGDFETAKAFAEKAHADSLLKAQADSLLKVIAAKSDSIEIAAITAHKEQVYDSLLNVAQQHYSASDYETAKATINEMDSEFRPRPQVQKLIDDIETATKPTDVVMQNNTKPKATEETMQKTNPKRKTKTVKQTAGKEDSSAKKYDNINFNDL